MPTAQPEIVGEQVIQPAPQPQPQPQIQGQGQFAGQAPQMPTF